MGYAKIACCDRCGKKRYVERINGRWLCLDCQDVGTERTVTATKASGVVESQGARQPPD
jgi:ribosomal protein L37AE/L43A